MSIGLMVVHYEAGLDRCLAEFEELGADHAELSAAMCKVIIGGRLNPHRLRWLRSVTGRWRLGYTMHAPFSLNLAARDDAHLHKAVATAAIELCGEIGARVLVVHTGWAQDGMDTREVQEREAAVLAELGDTARDHGVLLALENMPMMPGETKIGHGADPVAVAAQVARIGHPNVTATLDVSHAHISAAALGYDFSEAVGRLARVARHLHVHDSLGRPGGGEPYADLLVFGKGDLHLPLGWGNIDWDTVLPRLNLSDRTTVTLEVNPQFAERPVLAEGLARLRELLPARNRARAAE